MADPGAQRVRLRAREGEDVEWTHRVAQRASTLKNMMDDAPTEDGVYPLPTIAAAELEMLMEMCEADSMPARLELCSIPELFRLVEGASFLDAPGALNHAQRTLASRLEGKRADELREVLGATDDFGSVEDRLAALAEPAFSPEGQLSLATTGSAGPPALEPQPSLSGVEVTDDAKEAALGMVDVGTLAELKGVSRSWLVLARRVLCSRLGRCEGQPAPTELAEITDLNIKIIVDAGRSWEAAAAGRMLPSLARLRWEGFEVSVAAVREVDLDERDEDEDEDERPFLGSPANTALLSCIEGEGEPPLELLLAAVACAGSGEIRGIPVQMMRDDSVSELDLQKINIGVEGGMLLAHLVPVMGRLTVANLLGNQLDAESAKILAEVAKQKGISLCGIQRDQTTADFSNQDLKPPDAILLGSDLSQAVVTDGLTSINLSGNQMCGIWTVWSNQLGTYTAEGITAIADALRVNGALTSVKLRGNELGDEGWGAIFAAICANKDSKIMSLDASGENIGLAGGKLIAKALCTSVTGTLTSFNLRGNKLGEEGWGAIFAAICGSKDSKIMSLDASGENIGLAGGKLIAKALRTSVTGALTALNLSLNSLKDEGVSAVCKAIQSNKETKIASLNFEDNGIVGPVGANAVAAMVAVTGALTSVKLRGNELGDEGWGAIFAAICGSKDSKIMSLDASGENIGLAGGKLIAKALCTSVTGALTSFNLRGNKLGEEGWGAIFAAICGSKDSKIMSLDASGENIGLAGGKLIAKALRTSVTGALTALNLSLNSLKDEGVSAVCKAIQSNKETKIASLNFEDNGIVGPVGANAVAAMVAVTGALTSVELRGNKLGDEGWGAIFAAICGSKDSKIMSLDASGENIGLAGGKLIAKALRTSVTGGLTALNLSLNSLKDEGVSAVCKAIQSNKETKIASLNFGSNCIGPVGANAVAAMVAVTGALKSINLSGNQLCGIWTGWRGQQHGTYTAEGVTAIADALRVNGALTKLSLAHNNLGEEGTKAICEALEQNTTLKELDIRDSDIGGSAGAKHVAKMVGVNGALTNVELRRNHLGDKGWGAIFAAICGNKDSKIMSLDAAAESIGPAGVKLIAEALRSSVTGALTQVLAF